MVMPNECDNSIVLSFFVLTIYTRSKLVSKIILIYILIFISLKGSLPNFFYPKKIWQGVRQRAYQI